jgi:calreticulin
MIDNPEYQADDELYLFEDLGVAAFDLWQVKSGTIFDNLLITDSVEEAKSHAAETFEPLREAEKAAKEKFDEEEKKRMEEESAKRAAEEESKKAESKDDGTFLKFWIYNHPLFQTRKRIRRTRMTPSVTNFNRSLYRWLV